MREILFMAVLSLVFVGCGQDNVDIVKNTTMQENKSMTLGVAIDGFKSCKGVEWVDESTKEQKIVSATCVVKPEVLKALFSEEDGRYQAVVQKEKEHIKSRLKNSVGTLETYYNKCKTEKSPALNEELAIKIATKFCTYKKGNFGANCDNDGLKKELKESYFLDARSWNFETLPGFFGSVAIHALQTPSPIWFGDIPKEIKSMSYKFTFFINTDNSITIKSIVQNSDGEVKQLGRHFMARVYER